MSSKQSPRKKEPQKKGRQKNGATFLPTLFAILKRSEMGNGKTMISWANGGKSLKVHDRDLFLTKVMPQYFATCSWNNFILQLKWYGFDRIGHDTFSHEKFNRRNRNQAEQIERLKQVKTWPEPPPSASLPSDDKKKVAIKKIPPKSKISRPQKKSSSHAVAKNNDDGDDDDDSTSSEEEVEFREKAASKPPSRGQSKRNVSGKSDDTKMKAAALGSRKGQPKSSGSKKSDGRKKKVVASTAKEEDEDSEEDGRNEKKELKFAMKVMAIMDHSESDPKTKEIVSWVDNGTALQIYDRKKFVAEVLPRHFGKIKFTTNFAARLRWHGFEKVRYDVYRHKHFNRQYPEHCKQIKRLKDLKETVWPLDRDLKNKKREIEAADGISSVESSRMDKNEILAPSASQLQSEEDDDDTQLLPPWYDSSPEHPAASARSLDSKRPTTAASLASKEHTRPTAEVAASSSSRLVKPEAGFATKMPATNQQAPPRKSTAKTSASRKSAPKALAALELEADERKPKRLENVNVETVSGVAKPIAVPVSSKNAAPRMGSATEVGGKRKSVENEQSRYVRRRVNEQPTETEEKSSGLLSPSCSIM